MTDDISSQLISKLNSSLHGMFSIQLDDSTDISNVLHLMVFVLSAANTSIKEAILQKVQHEQLINYIKWMITSKNRI